MLELFMAINMKIIDETPIDQTPIDETTTRLHAY